MPLRQMWGKKVMNFTQILLSFLAGALCPTVMIYLTGGSNKTNLVIGLVMGGMAVLLPILLKPRQIAKFILGVTDGAEAFKAAFSGVHTAEKVQDGPAPLPAANPLQEDAISALTNLGLPLKRSTNLISQLLRAKEYGRVEDLIQDAMKASKPTRVA
jgi:hypothetical protein